MDLLDSTARIFSILDGLKMQGEEQVYRGSKASNADCWTTLNTSQLSENNVLIIKILGKDHAEGDEELHYADQSYGSRRKQPLQHLHRQHISFAYCDGCPDNNIM